MSAAGSQAWLLREREAEAAREVAEGNVACVWCGQPLELDDQCFAAELGAPVHVGCFEVLAQAGEVRDLAADRSSGSWQEDAFQLWLQAIRDRDGRRGTHRWRDRQTFPARFRSQCRRCSEQVEEGTPISFCAAVDGFVHEQCWLPRPDPAGSGSRRATSSAR